MAIRAVIYARYSDRPDDSTTESIEMQVEACRRFAGSEGLLLGGTFDDRALSGASAKRPGLWDAIATLQRGWILVVYKWDRLARDGMLFYSIEKAVGKAGGSIATASGQGTWEREMSSTETLRYGILKLFAEFERNVIRERTSAAMRRHQLAGRRMTRPDYTPFGVVCDPETHGKLIPEPDEQAAIVRILEMHGEGMSYAAIGRMLELEERRYRGRRAWDSRNVRRIVLRANRSP